MESLRYRSVRLCLLAIIVFLSFKLGMSAQHTLLYRNVRICTQQVLDDAQSTEYSNVRRHLSVPVDQPLTFYQAEAYLKTMVYDCYFYKMR